MISGDPFRADHQRVGLVGVDDGDAVRPADLAQALLHGLLQVALVVAGKEVGQDLGVGLALELDAFLLQELPQGRPVLDDAVVDDGQFARHVGVRVGVDVVGRPVGGPAGVRDAEGGGGVGAPQAFFQGGDAALGLDDRQPPVMVLKQRHPGRVVPAVLQALQAFQEDRVGLLRADVSDDAAHAILLDGRSGTLRRQSPIGLCRIPP